MVRVRNAVTLLAFAAVVVGLCVHTGFGTYSSAGLGFVASICPLGALEGLLGAWAFVPRLVIGLVAMVLLVFVFGRAFCGWLCPVPPLTSFFKTKKRKQAEEARNEELGEAAYERYALAAGKPADGGNEAELAADGGADDGANAEASAIQETKARLDSRHLVLCGALGSAAIFGFPVFCLICPIGLSCAFLVLLMRLVGIGELSWGLLVFPVVVVLELTLLRDYCAKICPVSALMSLIARANRTFRPKADTGKCLRDVDHAKCHACATACPVHIDPRANLGAVAVDECMRCGRCAQACPKDAISFPALPKK